MPEPNILHDKEFIKISQLNDGTQRRRSIVGSQDDSFSDAEPSRYDPAPRVGRTGEEAAHMAAAFAESNALRDLQEPDDGQNGLTKHSSARHVAVEAANGDIYEATTHSSEGAGDNFAAQHEERMFHTHIRHLRGAAAKRYRKENENEFISYFDDVAFEPRPSIIDGTVSMPIQTDFRGPTLEREVKKREKAWRTYRKQKMQGGKPPSFHESVLHSSFSGIYVSLWMALAFAMLKSVIDYYILHESFGNSEILRFMTTNIPTVAAVDFAMYMNTYFVLLVHYLCKWHILDWSSLGWKIVSVYEFLFVIFYMYLAENVLKLSWLSKIFIFLHSLVLLMKMHSFAFYNGYLWDIQKELNYSQNALAKLKDTDSEKATDLDETLATLNRSVIFCKSELQNQSLKEPFPANINLKNYFMFSMFPTLVYQIEYPRTPKIRWSYVVEKLFAIFGTIFMMMVLAQSFMYPIAMHAIELRDSEWNGLFDRILRWSKLLVDLVPSFIVMYLLTFYLIWDAILNCIAELTMFSDRYFYGDWWNCVSWDEFSRIWNIPVHKFLVRHVYHSSMSALKLTKSQATLMTFFLSSVVHEMAMYVLFKKFRLYLFTLQMLQLPLVAIGHTKYLKERTVLGNVLFWVGICTGPSVTCTLYLCF